MPSRPVLPDLEFQIHGGLVADSSGGKVVEAHVHVVDCVIAAVDPCGVYPAPAANPSSTERLPSASSGGSAAAALSGVVAMALGSDTWALSAFLLRCGASSGSSDLWAGEPSWCEILGLVAGSIGPLAAMVEDCALTLGAIAGPDPADPSAGEVSVPVSRPGHCWASVYLTAHRLHRCSPMSVWRLLGAS